VGHVVSELSKEVSHPHNLATHFRKCGVFQFGAQQGYVWLEAASPLDSTPTNTHGEAASRSAVVRVASQVGIGISCE